VDASLREYLGDTLNWFPEKNIGYYPVDDGKKYNQDYFNKYERYAKTEMGRRISTFRKELVRKYTQGKILDIGIGCGSFLQTYENGFGYDINPVAKEWLIKNELWYDPYEQGIEMFAGITFFDSLEHIENFSYLLRQMKNQFLFVSIPLFRDLPHLLQSKHLRKDEHYYYFTQTSFMDFMTKGLGFTLLEIRDDEIELGREDIWTFVFRGKCNELW